MTRAESLKLTRKATARNWGTSGKFPNWHSQVEFFGNLTILGNGKIKKTEFPSRGLKKKERERKWALKFEQFGESTKIITSPWLSKYLIGGMGGWTRWMNKWPHLLAGGHLLFVLEGNSKHSHPSWIPWFDYSSRAALISPFFPHFSIPTILTWFSPSLFLAWAISPDLTGLPPFVR